jgi:hypothetical protein
MMFAINLDEKFECVLKIEDCLSTQCHINQHCRLLWETEILYLNVCVLLCTGYLIVIKELFLLHSFVL